MQGGKVVTLPLAPFTAPAIDLVIGERVEGPSFLGRNGEPLAVTPPGASCDGWSARPITNPVGPQTLRHAFITTVFDAGVPLRTCKRWPATAIRARRCATTGRGSLDRRAYVVAAFLAAPPVSVERIETEVSRPSDQRSRRTPGRQSPPRGGLPEAHHSARWLEAGVGPTLPQHAHLAPHGHNLFNGSRARRRRPG